MDAPVLHTPRTVGSDPTKILIINRGALGNIVHTLPFLAMVRKTYSTEYECWTNTNGSPYD